MSKRPLALSGYLLIAIMLGACASTPTVVAVPDTQPGDQIQDEYLLGKWCTNREETATSNRAAGFSGLLNVRPVFWRFGSEGKWDASTSGFIYQSIGSWQIDGLNNMKFSRKGMEPKSYQASFKNIEDSPNLYLTDDKGQFTVLSRCK
ncbi:MAG: hypothetical protein GY815_03995 [Gammaproteobacteria bacterium]|nr:hypothetical protein [Gammaproteobacteria bacterium]